MTHDTETLRIVLHAPTASALDRARSNASNIRKEAPTAEVRIVANGEGVPQALNQPNADTDALTWLCPNTLRRMELQAAPPLQVLQQAGVLAIAVLQGQGWTYIRA